MRHTRHPGVASKLCLPEYGRAGLISPGGWISCDGFETMDSRFLASLWWGWPEAHPLCMGASESGASCWKPSCGLILAKIDRSTWQCEQNRPEVEGTIPIGDSGASRSSTSFRRTWQNWISLLMPLVLLDNWQAPLGNWWEPLGTKQVC